MNIKEYIDSAARHIYAHGTITIMTDADGMVRHEGLLLNAYQNERAIEEAVDIASAVYHFMHGDMIDPPIFSEEETNRAFEKWEKHKENQQ